MKKRLWLLTQGFNNSYDTYDSCVVVAATNEDARNIHPMGKEWRVLGEDVESSGWFDKGQPSEAWRRDHTWAPPDKVNVQYVGEAGDTWSIGDVVCASFNAG